MVAMTATAKAAHFELQQASVLSRLLLVLALWSTTGSAWADGVVTGRVVGLADGDTITVLDQQYMQHKVRFAGIDAPEKAQAFGNRAKSHLAMLVMGQPVNVEWHKKDRYGRIVGIVRVNGRDAGLEQVRAGMAWHYSAYSKEQSPEDRAAYSAAQDDARVARRGLWVDKSPQPPWDFRASKRSAQTSLQ
jgi:endonuclease YncB( thermonuclease family)